MGETSGLGEVPVGERENEDDSIAGGGVVGLWCADASQCGMAVGAAVIGRGGLGGGRGVE